MPHNLGTFSCNGLRRTSLNAVRGSQLEKYVKRLGSLAVAEQRPLNDMTDVQVILDILAYAWLKFFFVL